MLVAFLQMAIARVSLISGLYPLIASNVLTVSLVAFAAGIIESR